MRPPKVDCPFCPVRSRHNHVGLWQHVHHNHARDPVAREWLVAHAPVVEGAFYSRRAIQAGQHSVAVLLPAPIAVVLGIRPKDVVEVALVGRTAVVRPRALKKDGDPPPPG